MKIWDKTPSGECRWGLETGFSVARIGKIGVKVVKTEWKRGCFWREKSADFGQNRVILVHKCRGCVVVCGLYAQAYEFSL